MRVDLEGEWKTQNVVLIPYYKGGLKIRDDISAVTPRTGGKHEGPMEEWTFGQSFPMFRTAGSKFNLGVLIPPMLLAPWS